MKSFQNFLKRCQHDLPSTKECNEIGQYDYDNEIANLYEKMAKYINWFLNEAPCVLASFTHDVQLESSQKLTSIASSPVSFTL